MGEERKPADPPVRGAELSTVIESPGRGASPQGADSPTKEAPVGGPRPDAPRKRASTRFPVPDWDRYDEIEYLAEGGMGCVFSARDCKLDRRVALKLVLEKDEETVLRFLREAKVQAKVEHEHVCQIFEVGEVEQHPYIAMQLINGEPLSRMRGALSLEQKLRVMQDVAEAIHAAHLEGLVHRDIKPNNILVERRVNGVLWPYVVDFGIAREIEATSQLTMAGMVIGTLNYMAPEQALGQAEVVDARSDVYSLGATLYFAIAGQTPRQATKTGTMLDIFNEEPTLLKTHVPDLPEDVNNIVMRCLEREPERRYPTALALAEDLGRYLNGEPVEARATSFAYRITKRARKHKTRVALSLGFGLVLLAVGIGLVAERRQTARRVALTQNYAEEVDRIEGSLRAHYLLPRHDMASERRRARDALLRLEQDMARHGMLAQGASAYSLGRGYVSLGDYAAARTHLERAWNDYHVRTPKTAYYLGIALATLYQQGLSEVGRISHKPERDRKTTELDRTLRSPALQIIAQAKGEGLGSTHYVEALIAFLDKRYDDALNRSEAATASSPWVYQADKLAGDVHAAKADELRAAGRTAEALSEYRRSEDAYKTAISKGQSDPANYLALCELDTELMTLQVYHTAATVDSTFENALQACDSALNVDSASDQAYRFKASAYARFAETLDRSGKDPTDALAKARELGQRAVELHPQDARSHGALAFTYAVWGDSELEKDADAGFAFERCIEHARRATELDPTLLRARNLLGFAHNSLGIYQRSRGRTAAESFAEAIRIHERTIEIDPSFDLARINLTGGHLEMAMQHGLDGLMLSAIEQAASVSKAALDINPNSIPAITNAGAAHMLLGRYRSAHGQPANESFKIASDFFERALLLRPVSQTEWYRGEGLALWAAHAADHGEEVDGHLDFALEHLRKAAALNPRASSVQNSLGTAMLLKARLGLTRNRPIDTELSEAERAFTAAKGRRPHPDRYHRMPTTGLADVALLRARAHLSAARRTGVPDEVSSARRLLDDSLRLIPQHFATKVLQAELAIFALDPAAGPIDASPAELLAQGRSAIDEAIALCADCPRAYVVSALLHLRAMQALGTDHEGGRRHYEMGLSTLEKARGIHPTLAVTLATEGALHLQRSSSLPSERRLAQRAFALLDAAITANRWLLREYGPLRAQAQKLSGKAQRQ